MGERAVVPRVCSVVEEMNVKPWDGYAGCGYLMYARGDGGFDLALIIPSTVRLAVFNSRTVSP